MSNPAKYDTGNNPANLPVLVRGFWWVGTASDFPYYNMSPAIWSSYNKRESGNYSSYVIFVNKASNGPSLYAPNSEADMIELANKITGITSTTEFQAISQIFSNPEYFIIDRNYPNITWELLSLMYDMSYIPSYPRGGASVYDLNQNITKNTGTLVNAPTFDGAAHASYGYHINFTGTSSQSITLASTITPGNGNWTVMMIVSFGAFDSTFGTLLTNSSGGPATSAFGSVGSSISYDNENGFGWATNQGDTTLVAGRWYYLTWVNSSASGGEMQMYVNGELDSGSLFSSTTSNGGPVNIIGMNNWASKQFKGDIGAVYYYTKSLSNEEILRNYFGGPIVASLTQNELYPFFAYDVSIRSSDISAPTIYDLAKSLGSPRGTLIMDGTARDVVYDFGGVIKLSPGRLTTDVSTGYIWTNNMTMCFWMKYNGSVSSTYFLTDERPTDSRISSTITATGNFRFQVTYSGGAGGTAHCISTTNVCDGNWHHVVCIWSNGSDGINNRAPGIYIYVDGAQEGFQALPVGYDSSFGTLYLAGSGPYLSDAEHDCYIGPFQLYSGVAFNNEQVLKNYYAHIFRFKN